MYTCILLSSTLRTAQHYQLVHGLPLVLAGTRDLFSQDPGSLISRLPPIAHLWVHWVGRRSHGRACLRARCQPDCQTPVLSSMLRSPLDTAYSHHHHHHHHHQHHLQSAFAPSAIPVFTCDAPTSTDTHTHMRPLRPPIFLI